MESRPTYDIQSIHGYKTDAIEFSTENATAEWAIKFSVYKDSVLQEEWTTANGRVSRLSDTSWLLNERTETLLPDEYEYAMIVTEGEEERVLLRGLVIVEEKL